MDGFISMNTAKRGKKNTDVVNSVATCWNQRLTSCMREAGLNQAAFAKAFKEKYGTGNTADVSRWMNVGNIQSDNKIIGLPSYDTMKRIADYFGVSVGYLTGETDYETFDLERVCSYLKISKDAGKAVYDITHGKTSSSNLFDRFFSENNSAALSLILTSEHFKNFINCIINYALSVDQKSRSVNHLERVCSQMDPDLRKKALEWEDFGFDWGETNSATVTPELVDAVHRIEKAIDEDMNQEGSLNIYEKLMRYESYEEFVRLVDEIVCDENMEKLVGSSDKTFSSVKEMKKYLEDNYTEDGK